MWKREVQNIEFYSLNFFPDMKNFDTFLLEINFVPTSTFPCAEFESRKRWIPTFTNYLLRKPKVSYLQRNASENWEIHRLLRFPRSALWKPEVRNTQFYYELVNFDFHPTMLHNHLFLFFLRKRSWFNKITF